MDQMAARKFNLKGHEAANNDYKRSKTFTPNTLRTGDEKILAQGFFA
jgi:hypothetical protein